MLAHAVGLCDEYPAIPFPDQWTTNGFEEEFETGMVTCVESYVGKVGGHEGVKLEEQILITPDGYEKLSSFPSEMNPYGTGSIS